MVTIMILISAAHETQTPSTPKMCKWCKQSHFLIETIENLSGDNISTNVCVIISLKKVTWRLFPDIKHQSPTSLSV
jgi:hypothetical protein